MIKYKIGEHDSRIWGTWQVIDIGVNYISKRILVLPQKRLSLQSHQHRSESWTIVNGTGLFTLDDQIIEINEQDQFFIKVGQKHRIENTGNENLIFIEIQMGKNLDENDIKRYEDDYGRI